MGWVESALSHVASINPKSAIGDQDHAFKAAEGGIGKHGDDDDAVREQTIAKLKALFSRHATLKHKGPPFEGPALAKHVKQMQGQMKGRKIVPAVGGGTKGNEKDGPAEAATARRGTLYICFAELFPGHALTHTSETFRGLIGSISSDFKELIKIVAARPSGDDVAIISDGRSERARREIRSCLISAAGEDAFTELWVVYDMETSLRQDVRNPKRKIAWTAPSLETLFVVFSGDKTKTAFSIVDRDLFTKSGESTNFSRSYTGVPFRNLAEIPRLTAECKQRILGQAAVGAFTKERVLRRWMKEVTHSYGQSGSQWH